MHFIQRFTIGSMMCCTIWGSVASAAEHHILSDKLPPAVKSTLQQISQGQSVQEIELEQKDGSDVYSIELNKNGKEREIKIASDGKLLGEETEDDDDEHEEAKHEEETSVSLADTPAGVQAAIRNFQAGGTLKGITSENEDGVIIYEAEYDVNGKEHSLKMASDGTILEIEKAVDSTALPAAVLANLQKKFPDCTVKKAETVEKHFIEVKLITDGGETHEVKLSPTGAMAESEDDD